MNDRSLKAVVRTASRVAADYRVEKGKGFRLQDFDPSDTGDFTPADKPRARQALAEGVLALAVMQERLYAQDRWSLLLIFQAMDAAGKDSAIKHVMSGVNPQGCQVASFKAPSSEELDHDYLWRCQRQLPERGRIGIFNRSHYEEVLVVRVHPELLSTQKIPAELVSKRIWGERYEDIRAFERYLARNGYVIRKFFLHVSRKEQKKRFLERLERPEKNWKFSVGDVEERTRWKDYMKAYEDTIRETAVKHAPWYVVPADHKWFTRVVVASAVIDALASLDLDFPRLSDARRAELARARRALLAQR
jgi:PPK2 family polyphosphate:nucleotide phosphotransferase